MSTVSFTGHRPNKFSSDYRENVELVVNVKNSLKSTIEVLIEQGHTRFICGGALGVDTWAAEIIIELKQSNPALFLIIAKPFPSQAAIWPASSKVRFEKMCLAADEVIDVSPDPYAAWKMNKRNQYMVNHSDIVVAVFDGTAGGTANCVRYAREQQKTIRIINPNDLR